MHALGLNPQDPQHEQYYRAMRVRNRLHRCHVLYIPSPPPFRRVILKQP